MLIYQVLIFALLVLFTTQEQFTCIQSFIVLCPNTLHTQLLSFHMLMYSTVLIIFYFLSFLIILYLIC